MLAVADLNLVPVLALGAVTITGLRINGFLSDELLGELQRPFSRATLTVVGLIAGMVGHFCWLTTGF